MKEKLPEWKVWLNYAYEDLESAEVLLNSENVFPRNVCYLCQQAVEKSLKSIFVFLNISFSRTHDLESLFANLPKEWKKDLSLTGLAMLTEWATEARYPGDIPPPSNSDAETSISYARNIYRYNSFIVRK